MKKVEVVIEGTGEGILMHSAQNMEEQTATKNPAKSYDSKIDAENVAYRNKKKELIVPSRCMKACILNAASWYKFGKNSGKPIIAGCTRIEETELVLLDKKGKSMKTYEIDKRPVNIQKAKIIRSRPLIREWTLKFTIIVNEQMLGANGIETLRLIIEEAGQRVGLLDNRPNKYGENGTFKLVKYLPKK